MSRKRNKEHRIYALICPDSKQVRYVGCTCNQDVRKRIMSLSCEEKEVSEWIKKSTPIISILEIAPNKLAAHKAELSWIKRLVNEGHSLYNVIGNPKAIRSISQHPVVNLCGKLNGSKSISQILEETKNTAA